MKFKKGDKVTYDGKVLIVNGVCNCCACRKRDRGPLVHLNGYHSLFAYRLKLCLKPFQQLQFSFMKEKV